MEGEIRGVQETVSAASRSVEQNAGPPTAGRLGQDSPKLSRRPKGYGHSRIFRKNSQRAGEKYPLADRRIGGPGKIQQDQFDIRRRWRFLSKSVSRSQHRLWWAGTRHGRDRKWDDSLEIARIQRDILQFQRLYAPEHASRRVDGNSRSLHFHPRFDWRGRRRADAPTHRATGVLARDAEYAGSPPGRC